MDFISYCFTPNDAFDYRNKAYGAYWLRKIYQKRLLVALGLGAAVFSVGLASPVIYASMDDGSSERTELSRVVELKAIEPPPLDPKEPPPPVEPPPPPPKISTVRFVPPEVAPDEEVPEEEPPPPQDSLKQVQAAAVTLEGDPNANPEEIIVEDPVNEEAGVVGAGSGQSEIFVVVEQMPEFPGGVEALHRFLSETVRYPDIARKAGVEGRVIVQFVVGPDGVIRDPVVIRGVGAGLDEEAVRAVLAMPPWIPGKQRGEPVNVRFSMPIMFRLR